MRKAVSSYGKLFLIYLRLGCVSFGGPVAHLSYFRDEFVARRKWLSDSEFGELLALCQFIPGPSSSQLGFAIGWRRRGLLGACFAWLGFTLPSAFLMIGFAYGFNWIGSDFDSIRRGLLIATVAVVGNAVWSLGRNLCPDYPRLLIAVVSAICINFIPTGWVSLVVIVSAGFFRAKMLAWKGYSAMSLSPSSFDWSALRAGGLPLSLFGVFLLVALILPKAGLIGLLAIHYQAGALVFGGGHVVLPLLHEGVVNTGYMTDETFLSGYSAAQVLPGPLFTFAAFLGTMGSNEASVSWLWGLGTLVAIFLPGMLLFLGIYPIWNQLKEQSWASGALEGANAAVVGLLLAAFINPVWSHGIRTPMDIGLALTAFILMVRFRTPVWMIIPAYALIGLLL